MIILFGTGEMAGMLTFSSRNLTQAVRRLTAKVFEIERFQVNTILIVNVGHVFVCFKQCNDYFDLHTNTNT